LPVARIGTGHQPMARTGPSIDPHQCLSSKFLIVQRYSGFT